MIHVIAKLIEFLKHRERVFIQTHNFPDHDAVASAFGLKQLLERFGIHAEMIYDKDLQLGSLKKMIRDLEIDLRPVNEALVRAGDSILLVDGCKGNANVTDLIGDEVAVIDHHQVAEPESVPFIDIRPDYGACSTIIGCYYTALDQPLTRDAATALMIGIRVDTFGLTRKVTRHDLAVYNRCFEQADTSYVNGFIRNAMEMKDLNQYRYLMDHADCREGVAFCHFPHGCAQNLLGVLADFFLMLQEIDFVMLCAHNGQVVNCSCRSETPRWDASRIIRDLLQGIGSGGGHPDMAGGVIINPDRFNPKRMERRLRKHLKSL